MNIIRERAHFLSTRRSVTIFCIALCLTVAGATGTVFAYREHKMDENARVGQEFEVGAATIDRTHLDQLSFAPLQGLGPGARESVLGYDYRLGTNYEFSSVNLPTGGFVASAASGSTTPILQPRASKSPKSPISTPQVPASVSVKPIASARSLSSADSRLAPVVKVQCGSATCPEGETCCNASCGACTVPGETCSQLVCGMSTTPVSVSCGSNTCNVGESCCNVSCGICARVGEPCDVTKECENQFQYPFSVSCGMTTCNTGLVCCNPSCGICARFGEPCSQTDCD